MALGQSSEEATDRRSEQLGQTEAQRPDGCLVWVLTETSATAGPAPALAQALSGRLEQTVETLVTPIDETPLVQSVAERTIHQYAPGDTDGTITRFLDHWHPDFCVVIGQPARPNLLIAAKARGIPLYQVAAQRMATSPRKLPGYLAAFDTCFASSASEANLLRAHLKNGSTQVEITGPLSDTVYALPCNEAECDDLSKLLGGRPVWLASEVRGPEIDIVEAAHRKAFRSAHRLLLILVPRTGEDAGEIVSRYEERGWRVARRTNLEEPDPETQVYVADTEDEELGLWYRLAPVSFIGGSLKTDTEPTDPYFAAALGSAVLHGPNLGSNPARFDALEKHAASMPVSNADDLGEAIITLLAPDKAASLAQAGWAATTESAHVVERLAEVMAERFFEREDAG